MRKLKATEVKTIRESMLIQQGNRCALCQLPCPPSQAALDHDHSTGLIRAVLHKSGNSLLGSVERGRVRFGIGNLSAFLHGASGYLLTHLTDRTGLLHPTHKTPDERRLARNTKARRARAAK